ncbi:LOW QUALITY PROTEIN: hypothetical protein PHMEG_0002779 [Phytophthora megakarya]|uniref:Uncharacterized protein n=1 Tax=Phytophthora megakarya TaxID=4795 RepID=A0A225WXY3_9STRA|nr:LOW QUALITY PROTEIN: hypothetical protein PHMEG_0002779 [Phytophthora megakarya]
MFNAMMHVPSKEQFFSRLHTFEQFQHVGKLWSPSVFFWWKHNDKPCQSRVEPAEAASGQKTSIICCVPPIERSEGINELNTAVYCVSAFCGPSFLCAARNLICDAYVHTEQKETTMGKLSIGRVGVVFHEYDDGRYIYDMVVAEGSPMSGDMASNR